VIAIGDLSGVFPEQAPFARLPLDLASARF
jgi:hypothetical protein